MTTQPTTGNPAAERHPVWPEGPPCADECPGDWSDWHYGYSAGYERAVMSEQAYQLDAALLHERRAERIATLNALNREIGRRGVHTYDAVTRVMDDMMLEAHRASASEEEARP